MACPTCLVGFAGFGADEKKAAPAPVGLPGWTNAAGPASYSHLNNWLPWCNSQPYPIATGDRTTTWCGDPVSGLGTDGTCPSKVPSVLITGVVVGMLAWFAGYAMGSAEVWNQVESADRARDARKSRGYSSNRRRRR